MSKLKRFMLSKYPELIAMLISVVLFGLVLALKQCAVPGMLFGMMVGFVFTKISSRQAYKEKRVKKTTK